MPKFPGKRAFPWERSCLTLPPKTEPLKSKCSCHMNIEMKRSWLRKNRYSDYCARAKPGCWGWTCAAAGGMGALNFTSGGQSFESWRLPTQIASVSMGRRCQAQKNGRSKWWVPPFSKDGYSKTSEARVMRGNSMVCPDDIYTTRSSGTAQRSQPSERDADPCCHLEKLANKHCCFVSCKLWISLFPRYSFMPEVHRMLSE